MAERRNSPERPREIANWYLKYSALGFQFASILVGCLLIGFWLDRKTGFEPWLTIAGTVLGFVGGSIWLYRQVIPASDAKAGRNGKSGV